MSIYFVLLNCGAAMALVHPYHLLVHADQEAVSSYASLHAALTSVVPPCLKRRRLLTSC